MNAVQSRSSDGYVPYCNDCRSYHAVPADAHHWGQLQCQRPWDEWEKDMMESTAPELIPESEVGSVVRLKAGGPRMTIIRLGKDHPTQSPDWRMCAWFDDGQHCQKEWFPVAALLNPTEHVMWSKK